MSVLEDQQLTDLEVQECPWAYYAAMHAERAGFYFDERINMFVCADYQLLRQIMRNPQLFSNVNSQNISAMREPPQAVKEIQAKSLRQQNILVSQDPPEHTRVRKMLDGPLRPRAIEALRPQIAEITQQALSQFKARGHFDAVAEYAVPIPVTVIADILGLDRKYAATIKTWSDASVEPLGMMISDARWIECAEIIHDFQQFVIRELEARSTTPQDDLLTHLVQARDDTGTAFSMAEMLGITQQLLVAGNETTTNGIAAGLQLLAENPQEQLRLRDHPERMLAFVNEVLRLESPVQGLFRVVRKDTELAGQHIPKGSRIMLRYAAANRDPQKYDAPNTLDIFRNNSGTQVGFGAGIHHCIGANLAREEMYQAFSCLLKNCSSLRLKKGVALQHHPSMVLRGLRELPLEFEIAS